jgi:hypothetical protein
LIPDKRPAIRAGEKGEDEHRKEILAILSALGVKPDESWAQAWLALADKASAFALHKVAHRRALGPPRPVDEEFRRFWQDIETLLDVVLQKLEDAYLAVFSTLDSLLQKTVPTADDLNVLRNNVPHNLVTRTYFFDRLNNAAWLVLLRDGGFFTEPPSAERDPESGGVSFQPWPESRYLARMAQHAPEVAQEIALEIPETQNPRVDEDLADIAVALPPRLAVAFVPKAKVWLDSPYHFLLPEKLGILVSHLARGGYEEEAVDLARSLLSVLPDPDAEAAVDHAEYRFPPEPKARFELHEYEEILKRHLPTLVERAGERALGMLCDLLESAIGFSFRRREEGPEDDSYVWRQAIETDRRTLSHDPKNLLVSAVRDASEQIIRGDPTGLRLLVDKLEARPWRAFHRIALHLLRVFPEAAPDLVRARLTDFERFEASGFWHEYALLARDEFGRLSPAEQGIILSWIDQGPQIDEQSRARLEDLRGRPQTDDAVRKYVQGWRLRHLARLRDVLPPEWRLRHDALVAEHGEQEHPEFAVHVGTTWVGPTSPKSAEELRAMTPGELVAFLQTWQPSGEPMSPSPEGLGRVLMEIVAGKPEHFAGHASTFKSLDPTYVRGLVMGLRDAVKQKRAFPWSPILDLCRWVLEQLREIPERKGAYADLDPGWVWTRKAVAELLSAGFEQGPAELSFELRGEGWRVLQPLTDDADPTAEDEARYGDGKMDPPTLAINTTRGEAMHAVIRYALWIRRHLERERGSAARVARGLEEMPEVKEVLEAHLDQGRDPSLAIRSVYGQWFPWLVLLDKEWARSKVPQIFPSSVEGRAYLSSAWEAYVVFCAPYDDVFEVLRDEYERATERIGGSMSQRRRLAEPDERLAEHLMTLYWRGRIQLDGPGSILARFHERAGDPLRAHALEFVGRSLHNSETVPPKKVLERLKALWERRLGTARTATRSASYAAELASFGWWLISRKFEDNWCIEQLEDVLKLTGNVGPDHLVVKRLAELSTATPGPMIDCLGLMIDGVKESWRVDAWTRETTTIIQNALKSEHSEVRQAAAQLINRLSARGHVGFRDLLPGTGMTWLL